MPIRSNATLFHSRRSRVVLDLQTVSWGENLEVPPESDEDEDDTNNGEDNGEEYTAGGDGEGSGRNSTIAVNLDAIADGFVDDDFLQSDDDDNDSDKHRRNKEEFGGTKKLSSNLQESLFESDVASRRTAAYASDTAEKVRASAPTTLPRTRREGLPANFTKGIEGRCQQCHRWVMYAT